MPFFFCKVKKWDPNKSCQLFPPFMWQTWIEIKTIKLRLQCLLGKQAIDFYSNGLLHLEVSLVAGSSESFTALLLRFLRTRSSPRYRLSAASPSPHSHATRRKSNSAPSQLNLYSENWADITRGQVDKILFVPLYFTIATADLVMLFSCTSNVRKMSSTFLYEPNIITFARVLWANICFSCTTFQREMFFWDGWSLLVGRLTVASVLFLIAVCKVIYLFNEFIHFP